MTDIRDQFYTNLKSRNESQRVAVETIDGPVMVVAGPGTGKTDVLSLRIGNIIEKTDTDIHNILCLTYTEAGAVEMRKRLLEYVGPSAYNAQVFTFHGFCNMVIHENIELFGLYNEFQPISDLEQFQILKDVIDQLPMDHELKRYSGRIYFETSRLRGLFGTMKLEQWSVETMHLAIAAWIEEMRDSPDFQYKRKYKEFNKGDLKESVFIEKVIKPMETLRASVDTFDTYNQMMRDRQRYDYHDMLTWVHDRFEENDDLLGRYQERFQYFLVDEFQDSNGIQMALLNLLVSQWGSKSDVFIVGDDDQSIYRFQGAMMRNIIDFKEQYDPEVVILTENYRSTQNILDASASVIECNEERLVAKYPVYTKDLVARADHAASKEMPEIHVYPNWTQETASLLKELTDYHKNGILQKESVAVIYRNHKQVEEIVHALEVREVPINVKRPVNILDRPLIQNILTILKYIEEEIKEVGSGEHLLFEILHYRFFKISAQDAGVLSVECRQLNAGYKGPRIYWRDVMSDKEALEKIKIKEIDKVIGLTSLLNSWIEEFHHVTLQELMEKILSDGGVLNYIFHGPNRSWNLQLIKTLFDYVKSESLRNPRLTLIGFLDDIKLMRDHGISMPVNKTLSAPNGVYFVTAHSAKGMQFDRVFMLGCTKRAWGGGKGGRGGYKLPGTLAPVSESGTDEDERRLFYVAMTRARKHLVMSYSILNDNGREEESSRFIQEVLDGGKVVATDKVLNADDYAMYSMDLMTPIKKYVPLIDGALIDRVLENYVLSLSGLNAYLECPRKFYFQYILRVPSARKTFFGFGTAVHSTLEKFIKTHIKDHSCDGSIEDLLRYFEEAMNYQKSHFSNLEFDLHMHMGEESLKGYYVERLESWKKPDSMEFEWKVADVHHREVPLVGVLDRIDYYEDSIVVTDYKTGKFSSVKLRAPKDDEDMGGDYWRQIVFYKLLVKADPKISKQMSTGQMDFVIADKNGKYYLKKIVPTPEEEKVVSDQIVETFAKIKAHEFHNGCEEETCYWCNLVKNEMTVDLSIGLPEEEVE